MRIVHFVVVVNSQYLSTKWLSIYNDINSLFLSSSFRKFIVTFFFVLFLSIILIKKEKFNLLQERPTNGVETTKAVPLALSNIFLLLCILPKFGTIVRNYENMTNTINGSKFKIKLTRYLCVSAFFVSSFNVWDYIVLVVIKATPHVTAAIKEFSI